MLEDSSVIPATEFVLWDENVEEVLPWQKYFGRNKQFSLDNMTNRIKLALAKLLQNMVSGVLMLKVFFCISTPSRYLHPPASTHQ